MFELCAPEPRHCHLRAVHLGGIPQSLWHLCGAAMSCALFVSAAALQLKRRRLPSVTKTGAIAKPRHVPCARANVVPTQNALPTVPSQSSSMPAVRWKKKLRYVTVLSAALLLALRKVRPVLAQAASAAAIAEPAGFLAGLTASFALVLASEIGDKTFFISALLSMKYSRVLVLIGTMLALGLMTVISVAIGQVFHALPASLNSTIPFDDYAAIALLVWFGIQNIRDGLSMGSDEAEELQGAKDVVAGRHNPPAPSGVRVVTETSSLIFLAEWGDKSMLATIALAAAKSPFGVIVGGVSGHLVASVIAVIGGSLLGKYISEKSARLVGGFLFLLFAVLTLFGRY